MIPSNLHRLFVGRVNVFSKSMHSMKSFAWDVAYSKVLWWIIQIISACGAVLRKPRDKYGTSYQYNLLQQGWEQI